MGIGGITRVIAKSFVALLIRSYPIISVNLVPLSFRMTIPSRKGPSFTLQLQTSMINLLFFMSEKISAIFMTNIAVCKNHVDKHYIKSCNEEIIYAIAVTLRKFRRLS